MLFHYTASNKDGKIIEADADFSDAAAALEYIKNQGLSPISLKQAKSFNSKLNAAIGSPINLSDKIFLAKYLSLMLKSGTDLFRAIDILISDFEKPAMRAFLTEVRRNLEKGQPFYSTFQNHKNIFSPVFINLIRAGELSGNLDKIFQELSVSLEKERDLKQRIRSAMTYPMLLVGASVAIVILLVVFAIPRMASMFSQSNIKIPTVTKMIFSLSAFLSSYGLYIFGFLFVLFVSLFFFFKFSPVGQLIFNRILYRFPVVSKVLKRLSYQRFASTFGALMRAGLPILENLEITATVVGNEEMKQAILRVAREGLAKGVTLGESFRKEPAFPQTIRTLVAVGEQAGHTEEILSTLVDFYEEEINNSVKSIVSLIEPIMLLFIGVVVGGIALAVILPVYQFVGQING